MSEHLDIPGRDLRVGDVVVFLGVEHRIDRLEPYEGNLGELLGEGARIAYAGDWSMTVPPDQDVTILPRPGGMQ